MTALLSTRTAGTAVASAALVLTTAPAGAEPVVATTAPAVAQTPSAATRTAQGEQRRRIVRYVVRSGDTATGLAVRFHAWTAELLALNDLSMSSLLYVGQRLRIPVVPKALRDGSPEPRKGTQRKKTRKKTKQTESRWKYADPSRERVVRVISHVARRYDVDRELALAISWQEAGWQMHHVSTAGAIGAMQVLPTTGAWMTLYVGRPLRLHRLRDNATAGVMLLRVLDNNTHRRRAIVGAYYQGLGAVQRHGLFPETKAYVANVLAIKRRLESGRHP